MKIKSSFGILAPEEKQQVIDLRDKYTRREVVDLIAQPWPEGLTLETNVSALCRFYAKWPHHKGCQNLPENSHRLPEKSQTNPPQIAHNFAHSTNSTLTFPPASRVTHAKLGWGTVRGCEGNFQGRR